MKLTEEYGSQLQKLGGDAARLYQGDESLLADETLSHVNLVGDPDHAVIVVARSTDPESEFSAFGVFSPLPLTASAETTRKVMEEVFTDQSEGMPANENGPVLVRTEISPSEGEWSASNFVSVAVENGYDCSNNDSRMIGPNAEVVIELKNDDVQGETTLVHVGILSPAQTNISGVDCHVGQLSSLEILLSGNHRHDLSELLGDTNWNINNEVSSIVWGPSILTSALEFAGKLRASWVDIGITSKDESQTRIVATKQ